MEERILKSSAWRCFNEYPARNMHWEKNYNGKHLKGEKCVVLTKDGDIVLCYPVLNKDGWIFHTLRSPHSDCSFKQCKYWAYANEILPDDFYNML